MMIDRHEYELWLINPVTQKLLMHFRQALVEVNRELADGNFLMQPDIDKKIGFKVGYKDCIQHVLYDILQQQEESEDDTASISAIWSPSSGATKEG